MNFVLCLSQVGRKPIQMPFILMAFNTNTILAHYIRTQFLHQNSWKANTAHWHLGPVNHTAGLPYLVTILSRFVISFPVYGLLNAWRSANLQR